MKRYCFFLLVLLAAKDHCFAQAIPLHEPDYNKPAVFSHLPDTIKATAAGLSRICASPVQATVAVDAGDGFPVAGQVRSAMQLPNRQTAIIALSNYPGVVLSLSKLTTAQGSVVFKGRMFSFAARDAYELQLKDDQYCWVKTSLYRIVNE